MTNQNQSGSKSLDEKLEQFNKSIKLYTNTCPLISLSDLINVNVDKLRGFSQEDCLEFASACIQYSIYLQRVENRESAKLSVCNGMLAKLAGREWSNYEVYGSADIKFEVMASENPKMREYLDSKMEHQAHLLEVKNLSNLIKNQAEVYREMSRCKK